VEQNGDSRNTSPRVRQQKFDKGAKKTNGERIVSSINGAGKTG